MKNIYVGNIPYGTTDDELREHFEQHGAVNSASIIIDKFTGKSRGFGFVEMNDDAEGDKAIEELNGSDFSNRNLIVNEARPRAERPAH